MDLQDIRQQINIIDEDMESLFIRRMECSSRVAGIKLECNEDIYKQDREMEICKKYEDNPTYVTFIKKIMEISRNYQYSIFASSDCFKEKYLNRVTEENMKIFSEGGILELFLEAASDGEKGLKTEDIISIISGSGLKIKNLVCEENRVHAKLYVENSTKTKFAALVLSYMLYMETV